MDARKKKIIEHYEWKQHDNYVYQYVWRMIHNYTNAFKSPELLKLYKLNDFSAHITNDYARRGYYRSNMLVIQFRLNHINEEIISYRDERTKDIMRLLFICMEDDFSKEELGELKKLIGEITPDFIRRFYDVAFLFCKDRILISNKIKKLL